MTPKYVKKMKIARVIRKIGRTAKKALDHGSIAACTFNRSCTLTLSLISEFASFFSLGKDLSAGIIRINSLYGDRRAKLKQCGR